MKVLELFAGTCSVSNAFKARGHEVFTVDWSDEFDVDLHADIGQLTAKEIIERFGHPDIIWASPDCTSYSVAAISKHRRKNPVTGSLDPISEYAAFCDKVNQHVLELIRELNPKYWFIENPRGGMRKMAWMQDLPRYTVTYNKYDKLYEMEIIEKMGEKKCPKCGLIKPIGEFYKNSTRKDGLSTYCKECIKNDSHEYYVRNKEKCKERLNNWRAQNREYVRERDARYREENPDIEFRKQQKYRETHKEQLYLKGKKYREENRQYFYDKAKERNQQMASVDDGTVTEEYKRYMFDEQHGRCAYCGCDLSESGKHIDHIIPISRGGRHTANNVQWTCPTCNLSKGDKLEEEWLTKARLKPTDIWTNHQDPKFLPPSKNGDKDHVAAPRGARTGTQGLKGSVERSRIPVALCEHIVDICEE